jgi:hypothetical protein
MVPHALSLLDPSEDVEDLIELIRAKASEIGEPIQLVIVDTLARAMAGANENSSEDMTRLVRAGDRIREETGAHLMWIHHSGKDQTKGARGHSSLRAALDTEMEVTADQTARIHTIAITKQRDLPTNGERLAGKFVPVELGQNQWGDPITACAVEDAEAPAAKLKQPRLGAAQQAIVGVLAGAGQDLKLSEIADRLGGQFNRNSVYNSASRLKDLGLVEITGGIVHLNQQ